jgi:cation diffusion facilitator CzcD-associated flavoprotein CzcO
VTPQRAHISSILPFPLVSDATSNNNLQNNANTADSDWEDFYSSSEYLRRYINSVVDKLDLRKYITFNSRVIEARFDEEKGTWQLKIVQTLADGTKKIINDDCDLLLGAVGILDRWELPKIPGLNTFKGRVIHSADRAQ